MTYTEGPPQSRGFPGGQLSEFFCTPRLNCPAGGILVAVPRSQQSHRRDWGSHRTRGIVLQYTWGTGLLSW